MAAFKDDPYGCAGDLLLKRLRRDPFAVGPIHPSRSEILHDTSEEGIVLINHSAGAYGWIVP